MRLGILGSTRGTHLQSIVTAIAKQQIQASIAVVISNKADAGILERAAQFSLPHRYISPVDLSREEYDSQVNAVLVEHQVDLVVLIGYMRILSSAFLQHWHNKVINVHPSLLPAFSGMMNMDVHRGVLAAKHTQTGCTVHYVIEEVDAGPIILQRRCDVLTMDTAELLQQRVQALEGEALVEAIAAHAENLIR